MYQNLALPIAKYAYDSSGKTTKKFLNFAKFAVGQEQREKMIYTNTSILNTEPRKQILPIDVSDILPK